MNATTANAPEQTLEPRLRITDPELPRLATRAAVEVDGLRRQSGGPVQALGRLHTLLINGTKARPQRTTLHGLFDTGTLVSLNNAFESAHYSRARKVSEIYEQASKVAEDFEAVTLGIAPEKLDKVAEFCVALAREATIQLGPRRGPTSKLFSR